MEQWQLYPQYKEESRRCKYLNTCDEFKRLKKKLSEIPEGKELNEIKDALLELKLTRDGAERAYRYATSSLHINKEFTLAAESGLSSLFKEYEHYRGEKGYEKAKEKVQETINKTCYETKD